MKVCVTGASGFLGRHLVQQLIEEDGHEVVALCRTPDPGLRKLGAVVVEGSVLEPSELEYAFDGCEAVFHLAGRVERLPEHAHHLYEIHVRGTLAVIQAMRNVGVQRLVYASSSGVVGVDDKPRLIDDEAPYAEDLCGRWPYYLSKIYAEKVVRSAVARDGLDAVILRPTLLLGPGDIKLSSTNDVLRFMKSGLTVAPPGGMSFVDVRDTAQAFRAALERGQTGRCYLLGAINLTVRDFYDRLARLTGQTGPLAVASKQSARLGERVLWALSSTPARDRVELDPVTLSMAHHFWYIDWTRAVAELGFAPRDPGDTLYDTVEWLRHNLLERRRGRPFQVPGATREPHQEPASTEELAERGERWARRIGGAARSAAQVAGAVGRRVRDVSVIAVQAAQEARDARRTTHNGGHSPEPHLDDPATSGEDDERGLEALLESAMGLGHRAGGLFRTTTGSRDVAGAPARDEALTDPTPPPELDALRAEVIASLQNASPEALHAALWAVKRTQD